MSLGCKGKEAMKKDYSLLIEKCKEEINVNHDYVGAYDYAVQAKLIAEQYLKDQTFVIESEMFRGLAQLGTDKRSGSTILNNLYYGHLYEFKGNIDLIIKLKTSLGIAQLYLGDYDKAIRIFNEVIDLCKQEVKKTKEKRADRYIKGHIYCLNQIAIALRYKSQRKKYPAIVGKIETQIIQQELSEIDKIQSELDAIHSTRENISELDEAEKNILEALKLSSENNFREMELICWLTYACILIEKDEYSEALKILDQVSHEKYIIKNLFVNVLNEMGLTYISTGKLEEGIKTLKLSWDRQNENKDYKEVNRTLYGMALYYYQSGNYSMAYNYADFTYKKDSVDLSSLELLYELTLLQCMLARKNGHEVDYIQYKSENDKYKSQICG